jgi:SH3 domain-containing kinase-binding protein 1
VSLAELARVLHPYTAAHEDELSLPVGALVTVLKKECDDAGWFYGELDGKRGVFPDNFVQLVAAGGGESMAATAPPASPPQQPATPAPMPPVVAPAAVVAQVGGTIG